MASVGDWPPWKRLVFANATGGVGAWMGLARSGIKLSLQIQVPIAVFTIAFMNLMLVVVAPRISKQRSAGVAGPNPFKVLYEILRERPFIATLCILQLLGASRSTAATLEFLQASASAYVRSQANAEVLIHRLLLASLLVGVVAVLCFSSAIGLWLKRSWGWWLAMILNALAATVSMILQILSPHQFLLDPIATIAVVILLVRPVRKDLLVSPSAAGATSS
jgi:hypothetical protein